MTWLIPPGVVVMFAAFYFWGRWLARRTIAREAATERPDCRNRPDLCAYACKCGESSAIPPKCQRCGHPAIEGHKVCAECAVVLELETDDGWR